MSLLNKLFGKKNQQLTSQRAVRPGAAAQQPAASPAAAASKTARSASTSAGTSCAPQPASNLERWSRSGAPSRWVLSHNYSWNHDDWLTLLRDLESSEFWPLDPEKVGCVLESLKADRPLHAAAN